MDYSDEIISINHVLTAIKECILNGDTESLTQILDYIDFDTLEYKQSIELLIGLLKLCGFSENEEAGDLIYNLHEKFYPMNSPVQFMTILFLEGRADIDLMSFLTVKVKKEFNFIGIVYELMQISSGYNPSQIKVAFNKAYKVFPAIPLSTLKELHNISKNISEEITEELLGKIRPINNYAPIPPWIINKGILPKESDIIIPPPTQYKGEISLGLLSPEDFAGQIMKEINIEMNESMSCSSDDTDIESNKDLIKEILLSQYMSLSLAQKYELSKNFVASKNQEAMSADVKLFITLGPSSPFLGASIDELDYGGARMFTFNDFEYIDEIDDFELDELLHPKISKDWFVGYCQQCNLRIRRRWHAVRVPQKFGGWSGCMCSWKCSKSSIIDFDQADPLLLTLCDVYEKEMLEYKILDRIPEDEYPEYLASKMNENKSLLEQHPKVIFDMEIEPSDKTSLEDVEAVVETQTMVNEVESPVILNYFYSKECEVCARFTPELEQLIDYKVFKDPSDPGSKETVGRLISVIKIDTDEVDVSTYGVTQVPTVILVKDGTPLAVFIGDKVAPISDMIQSFRL